MNTKPPFNKLATWIHLAQSLPHSLAMGINMNQLCPSPTPPPPQVTPSISQVMDRTQGPACSIACGPATVVRNYFAPLGGSVGQRRGRPGASRASPAQHRAGGPKRADVGNSWRVKAVEMVSFLESQTDPRSGRSEAVIEIVPLTWPWLCVVGRMKTSVFLFLTELCLRTTWRWSTWKSSSKLV